MIINKLPKNIHPNNLIILDKNQITNPQYINDMMIRYGAELHPSFVGSNIELTANQQQLSTASCGRKRGRTEFEHDNQRLADAGDMSSTTSHLGHNFENDHQRQPSVPSSGTGSPTPPLPILTRGIQEVSPPSAGQQVNNQQIRPNARKEMRRSLETRPTGVAAPEVSPQLSKQIEATRVHGTGSANLLFSQTPEQGLALKSTVQQPLPSRSRPRESKRYRSEPTLPPLPPARPPLPRKPDIASGSESSANDYRIQVPQRKRRRINRNKTAEYIFKNNDNQNSKRLVWLCSQLSMLTFDSLV